jgi:solute carrier family 35, member E1
LPHRELSPRINFVKLNAQAAPVSVEHSTSNKPVSATAGGFDVAKFTQFALWYLGNYYYNISNKQALKAAGGATGFPMTLSCLQLGVGVLYALFLWAAPDARSTPKITINDFISLIPVGICAAGAHTGSVFAMGAGAVSFAQVTHIEKKIKTRGTI